VHVTLEDPGAAAADMFLVEGIQPMAGCQLTCCTVCPSLDRQASCRQAPVSKECSAAIALLTTQANPYELTGKHQALCACNRQMCCCATPSALEAIVSTNSLTEVLCRHECNRRVIMGRDSNVWPNPLLYCMAVALSLSCCCKVTAKLVR